MWRFSAGGSWNYNIQCWSKIAEVVVSVIRVAFSVLFALTVSGCLCLSLLLCPAVCLCFYPSPSICWDGCPTSHQGESILHSSTLSVFLSRAVCSLYHHVSLCHFISVSLIHSSACLSIFLKGAEHSISFLLIFLDLFTCRFSTFLPTLSLFRCRSSSSSLQLLCPAETMYE